MVIERIEPSAFASLLNRVEAREHIAEYFADIPAVLADLVDYGTHLIPRCLASSKHELADLVALAILLKQAVGMLDGAQILFQEGAVQPSTLQLRALFEVSVYLDWLL